MSGLLFNASRGRWLRQFNIQASGDNTTFVDWGTYTATNFTDASIALFSFPIRAQFFNINVLRYANHYVNETGFPISVQALVSHEQPFSCGCPLLSNGECCPFLNMTVRNDTCIWCMDPMQISTVVINGCGKCKYGTFEHLGRCVYSRPSNAINNMQIANPMSDGVYWTTDLNINTDSQTMLMIFLTTNASFVHPCVLSPTVQCLTRTNISYIFQSAYSDPLQQMLMAQTPLVATQFLQFDRGRYSLNMTQGVIRSWAQCTGSACTGAVGALFLTRFSNQNVLLKAQQVIQPLIFNFRISNFVTTQQNTYDMAKARAEIHHYKQTDTWIVRIIGIRFQGEYVYVGWDGNMMLYNNGPYIAISNPPEHWNTLKLTDEQNTTTLEINQPITIVTHDTTYTMQNSGIQVQISYGFNFTSSPQPGDSEQIVNIVARSPQPIRLQRLALTMPDGLNVMYTSSKGFIINPSRVMDLSIACQQPVSVMVQWLTNAISIVPSDASMMLTKFAKDSCSVIYANTNSKAYWMVPARPPTPRTTQVYMGILAEFA